MKRCENIVRYTREKKARPCGLPAAGFFDGKHRCEWHLVDARRRHRERTQAAAERAAK